MEKLCKLCGEDDPELFRAAERHRCKACLAIYSAKYYQEKRKRLEEEYEARKKGLTYSPELVEQICILARCDNQVPPERQRYRSLTCSKGCSKIHNLNSQTIIYAKKKGAETTQCSECSKLFILPGSGSGKCKKCHDQKPKGVGVGVMVESGGKRFIVAEVLEHCRPRRMVSANPVTESGFVMTRTFKYLGGDYSVVTP